jgi:hypothetical protein
MSLRSAYISTTFRANSRSGEPAGMVLSNCKIDTVNITPTYRKPFDLIFERTK